MTGKTIIVSNRLPVKIQEKDGGYNSSPSEGGLATGLGSIYQEGENVWIGWPGTEIAPDKEEEITAQLASLSLLPVFLSQEEISEYYEGFSNEVLWPIFHYYASTYSTYRQSNWQFYQQVNQKFADAVLNVAKPGDTIWVHDYQLLLVPALIRKQLPDVSIGFFLHIPFPSFELFHLIPWRNELLEGLLGADLIGFHTFDDVQHFTHACARLLHVNLSSNVISLPDRLIVAEAFPMGIDEQKYASLAKSETVKQEIENLNATLNGVRAILSVDRLDYSKGILQRLQAFEELLKNNPEYLEKVVLYMIVVPSRDTVPQYKHLRDEIDKRVGNINSLFRTLNWSPVQYFYRSFPIETLSALYATADVALVTPMRDGMNLVSKEYVASRINNDGVLILSEMAGSSRELIDAIIVNPNDMGMMAAAIKQALEMPAEEQESRMVKLRKNVSKFNVKHWVKIFMDRLSEVKEQQQSLHTRYVSSVTKKAIYKIYAKTHQRIFFLDYDGTLVGFNADINKASPDKELYQVLQDLSSDPANKIVIISGRDYHTLDKWFGHLPIALVAEHGAWQKLDGEWKSLPTLNDQWKKTIQPVLETFADRTPGSFIEEKTYSLAWHYRNVGAGLGELRAGELINNLRYITSDQGLQILPGNKVIEVKNIEINKGKTVMGLLHDQHYDFAMAIGDDHTDEDTFKAMPENSVTIKVGNNSSEAKYFVNDFKEVRALLKGITKPVPVEE
ncbi:bifunctional alpha,alpha-trehalose-phosphate synthase (UDP-forming)/trehalose-phosphatase [Mucilaginibacter arboris]|uniref:Alpha,alpha-trehalose-phosphate synthase n=1 Tax=Mucilaginibacter arboris TaxID=2682090 RepID=A0A7K1SZL1_9SPHI|nr:bifunctional alpha,alpha-trehalose-phosphate synthase (UDP-forming)/trehalose-phosphatase [Mucilaginibacter arboris]MVN22755.1 bifunctional alpha,alpha-trehalose-phosphate synthase (UDP-forming)/trehalose-phosphatase [Mucilaginibacter arboris]